MPGVAVVRRDQHHPVGLDDGAGQHRLAPLAALALGGTASGEHGVGITKRPWLADEIGQSSLDLQRRLKAVFDPRGILNPHTFLATDSCKDDS